MSWQTNMILLLHVRHSLTGCIGLQRTGLYRYRGFGSLNQYLVVTQTSMNATLQMEAVNTVVLTLLGVSSVAVTLGTKWMKMDWTAAVRSLQMRDLHDLVHSCSRVPGGSKWIELQWYELTNYYLVLTYWATYLICMQAGVIICYSLLANAIYTSTALQP